tara:strand:+ start:1184 stop:2716 length:1533 start_codon:yes stop_codon:yes gene_type:complete
MKSMSGFGGGVASLSMKSAGAGGEQYSGLISNGLDILLDAGNSSSYSGSGSTITNIAPSGTSFGNATIKQGTYTANAQGAAGFQNLRAWIDGFGTITYPTFTYNVWVNFQGDSSYNTIIDQNNDSWFFGLHNKRVMTYNPGYNTLRTLQIAKWYNLCVAHTQGGNIKFYVNGVPVYDSGGSTSSSAFNFGTWSFGAGSVSTGNTGNEPFIGYIALISIYNRELSATEIKTNFDTLASRYDYSSGAISSNNLICHLDANNSSSYGGSGTTWSDLSSSNNNFTLASGGATPTYETPTNTSSVGISYFNFDGIDDYASNSHPTAFDFGTDSFTIGMWCRINYFDVLNDAFFSTHDTGATTNFSTNSFEIRRNGSDANGYPRWEHRMQESPSVKFEVGDGTGSQSGKFIDNRWYYWVTTFENSSSSPYGTVKIYLSSYNIIDNYGMKEIVSGTSAAANGGQHNFTQNNVVYLMKNRPSSRFTGGFLAELHVYKGSALSLSEITANFNATKGRYF